MNPPPLDEEPRDAHLLVALRHAPDRGVVPPAHVTAAILGQARQAVRPAQAGRTAWRHGLRKALDRLLQPAPMAAFGTLAMATLIGVLWSGQDLPEATPSLRPEPAAAPTPAQAPTASSAAGPAALAQAPPPAADLREAATAPARAPRGVATPPPRLSTALPSATSTPAPSMSPTTAIARPDPALEDKARRDAAGVPPPEIAAVPAPTRSAATAPVQQREAVGKSLADAAPLPLRARGESAAQGSAVRALAGVAPTAAAAAEIDAAASGATPRVQWRVSAQRLVAHGAAQRDWWSVLQRATEGRWQRADPRSAGAAQAPPMALLIDGAVRGGLSFEPQAVRWSDADGVAWRAPIAAETSRAWQEAIASW